MIGQPWTNILLLIIEPILHIWWGSVREHLSLLYVKRINKWNLDKKFDLKNLVVETWQWAVNQKLMRYLCHVHKSHKSKFQFNYVMFIIFWVHFVINTIFVFFFFCSISIAGVCLLILQIDFSSSRFYPMNYADRNRHVPSFCGFFFLLLISSRAVSIIELKKFIIFYFWIMINLRRFG